MPKSSLSHFFSNVLSSGLGKASTVVFGILCMFVYARWMSQEDFGGFVLFQVLIGLGLSFGELGMDIVTTRFIAGTEDARERRKIINTGILFRAFSMVLICLLIFIFQDKLYGFMGGKIPQLLLLYLPVSLFVEGLLEYYSYILQGLLKFKDIAVISFIYGLTSFILTVILVIPFDMGAHGLVWARLLPNILCLVLSILAVKSGFLFEFDLEWFKRLFKFGIPLYGNKLLAFAYSRADTLVIGYFFGPAEIAIYEFARRIPDSLQMFYDSFIDVYFSFISKLNASENQEKISDMVNHANRLTGFIGGLAVILSFGLGEQLFLLVFSEQYLSSIPIFIVLMVVLVVLSLNSNVGYSLIAIGEPAKPLFTNIIRFGFVLASYFLLIPYFKVIGVALSALLGLICATPLNAIYLRRHFLGVNWDSILRPLLLLALAFIPLYFIGNNIFLMTIIVVLYIAGAYGLGIITSHDIQIINQEIRKLASRLKIQRIQ